MKHIIYRILLCAMIMVCLGSCEGFLQIDPPKTDIVPEKIFKDDNMAIAAIVGMYSLLYNNNGDFVSSFGAGKYSSIFPALLSDEVIDNTGLYNPFQSNSILANNIDISGMWQKGYAIIYTANAILEGLEGSAKVTPALKRQLKGEALFIRSFCFFQLYNYYGKIPMVLVTYPEVTKSLPRTEPGVVLQKLIIDLQEAETLLPTDYSSYSQERIRAVKWAVTALMARIHLYSGSWDKAETKAAEVIGNSSMFRILPDLKEVFLKNSTEAIWQLNGYSSQGLTFVGLQFTPANTSVIPNFVLREQLLSEFENGDRRKGAWISLNEVGGLRYYYPAKYKQKAYNSGGTQEYDMVLRLAEMYLIRAEARLEQDNLSGARADLDTIRKRAGLEPLVATTKEAVRLAIEHERRVELFTEWGHRWFDLKRTGRANAVLGVLKPNWKPTDVLYPVPEIELSKNPNLKPQNEGY